MLDLGWTELLLIAGVAVLVIRPKDLPGAMRTVGKYVGQLKRMARGFQSQVNEALREAELDDVKKTVESIGKIDPVGDIKKEIRKVDADLRKDLTLGQKTAAVGTDVAEATTSAATAADDGDAAGPAQSENAAGEAKT